MKTEAFKAYLLHRYPEPKSKDYRGDIISRCRRIENELGIDLDDYDPDSIQSHHETARGLAKSAPAGSHLVAALNRYGDFLATQS